MRKVKRFGIKDFEADMIVYDWDIELVIDDTGESRSGYRIFGKKKDDKLCREIYIVNDKDYWFVLFPQDGEGKQKRVPLHKLIYAYYCGWRSLDVMEEQNIHHMNRNKRDNRIENLIALTTKEHLKIHEPERRIKNPKQEAMTPEEFNEWQEESKKILNRAFAIKNNTIKARGNKVKKFSDIIWED